MESVWRYKKAVLDESSQGGLRKQFDITVFQELQGILKGVVIELINLLDHFPPFVEVSHLIFPDIAVRHDLQGLVAEKIALIPLKPDGGDAPHRDIVVCVLIGCFNILYEIIFLKRDPFNHLFHEGFSV